MGTARICSCVLVSAAMNAPAHFIGIVDLHVATRPFSSAAVFGRSAACA